MFATRRFTFRSHGSFVRPDFPAVVLDAASGLFDSVSSNGRSAGAEIFSYLGRAGYRTFAFFGLARYGANSETRMAGFVEAAKLRGADVSAKIVATKTIRGLPN